MHLFGILQLLKTFYREKHRDFPGSSPRLTGKFTGIYQEVYRNSPGSSPGCTRKFTGMYQKVSWDMAFSSLDSLGNPGKCRWAYWERSRFTEKAWDLPRYRDKLLGISPVNDRWIFNSLGSLCTCFCLECHIYFK